MHHPEVPNFHIAAWKGGGEISITQGVEFDEAWKMLAALTGIDFNLTDIRRAIRQGRSYYPRSKFVGNLVGIVTSPFSVNLNGINFTIPGPDGNPTMVELFNAKPASKD